MTGSALFDFLIAIVLLAGAVYMFFYAIDGIAPDPLFNKIARLAVGLAALVVFLIAVKGVLFGGGAGVIAISPMSMIQFAVGVIVVLLVIFLIKHVVNIFVPEFTAPIMYVLGGVALIALLLLAGNVLSGGRIGFSPERGITYQSR